MFYNVQSTHLNLVRIEVKSEKLLQCIIPKLVRNTKYHKRCTISSFIPKVFLGIKSIKPLNKLRGKLFVLNQVSFKIFLKQVNVEKKCDRSS